MLRDDLPRRLVHTYRFTPGSHGGRVIFSFFRAWVFVWDVWVFVCFFLFYALFWVLFPAAVAFSSKQKAVGFYTPYRGKSLLAIALAMWYYTNSTNCRGYTLRGGLIAPAVGAGEDATLASVC